MDKDLNVLTKKYWLRFVVTALTNAAIFTTYRLYINHLNKKNKTDEDKNNDSQQNEIKNNSPKIKLMDIEVEQDANKISPKLSKIVKSKLKPQSIKINENTINKLDDVTPIRKTGRPKKENKPPIKHLQKDK